MAVYTDVSAEDLASFLADYDIGEPHAFKGIAEGVENTNYYLQTAKGAFILTLYEKRVRETDLPFFLDLMEHLARRGIPCPTPLRRRDAAAYGLLNGRPAAILAFLEGVSLRRPEPVHGRAAGRALAALHRAGMDFPARRANALGHDAWAAFARSCAASADTVQPGLAAMIVDEADFLARSWPKDLPRGVIHGDLFPDNVLFMGGTLSGLIDFYFACNDGLAYDLAVMINAWCFEPDGAFNVTKARSLIAGYEAGRALTVAERAALPVLARGAALRFLLTRLHDWLNQSPGALVRPKDPKEFVPRLKFHQGVAGPEAYGL